MLTRRNFAQRMAALAAGAGVWTETALAQRALVRGELPAEMVWLNANENPDGPGEAALRAMADVAPHSWRYHYQEFREFYANVARSENLEAGQVLVGAGSSEILHAAVEAFTSPERPLITMSPTFEAPAGLARAMDHPVIRVPLTAEYTADVKALASEAEKAGGGLIYVCNPNNPTSTVTRKSAVAWLVANLPRDTILLVDEAYIHFSEDPELESALRYVREAKPVVVSRTFSKIYGMAGLRIGFACARGDLISRMEPFRDNVISVVSARAARAALADESLVPERRARAAKIRRGLCEWLRSREISYIEPHANFVMIDVGRDVRQVIPEMVRRGVAPGRPFPPLDHLMRVTIGSESDMEKFKSVFMEVYKA